MIPLIMMDIKLGFNMVMVRIQCELLIYSAMKLDPQMNLL